MLNSMKILFKAFALILPLFLANTATAATESGMPKPNILFIAIDDLNDWIGSLGGHPQAATPAMDRLSRRGVLFTEAHCPAPVCGPSRASIMSGLWPHNTGVYSNNAHYPKQLSHVESMPQYLRRHGFLTLGAGKLFHGDTAYPEGSFDDYAASGKGPFPRNQLDWRFQNPSYTFRHRGKEFTLPLNGMPVDRPWQASNSFDWGPVDLPDEEFKDTQNVNWAIGRLGRKYDQPFFLGVGFSLPHQPLFAPKRFHDLHPPDKVVLPPYLKTDLDDLPRSGKDYALIATTSGTHRTVVAFDQWRNAVSSYLATVSFVDYLLGRLLAALETSVHADNTWIILWSDHGWHLGEKDHWGKATGWYRATRVPLIIVPPAKRAPAGFKAGTVSNRPVNLVDLFPTVADIGRLPIPSRLDGKSLIPLIENPNATWKDFTVTTFGRGNHAVTTNRWRYIQYFDGGAELYDRENDPNEWNNLILEKRHESVIERLKAHVPEEPQWRHFIRYNNFKAVVPSDGNPMLLFNHDVENNLEERFDESADYPEVVAYIQKWTKENQPRGKRLDISDPRVR